MNKEPPPPTFLIPLLKLPISSIHEVVQTFSITEVIDLAQCSERMRLIIKDCYKLEDHRVELDIGHWPVLTIKNREGEERASFWVDGSPYFSGHKIVIREDIYETSPFGDLWTFEEPALSFIQVMFQEIFDLLPVKLGDLDLSLDTYRHDLAFFDWVKNFVQGLGKKFKCLMIYNCGTEEELHAVLDIIEIAENLKLWFKPPLNFRREQFLGTFDKVFFEHSYWLTLDNIIQMDWGSMHLGHESCFLTDMEINTLIKHFIAGGKPRMRMMMMCFSRRLIHEEVERDIELTERVGSGEKIEFYEKDSSSTHCFDKNGKDFKLNNGLTGTIYYVIHDPYDKDEEMHIVIWK